MNPWLGKRLLITGVAGTIGHELLRQLVWSKPAEIIGIDSNESELFFLQQEFAAYPFVHLYVADIRDCGQLSRRMEGIDIVLHTAAYKHVFLCEQAPSNAIQTNILGTQNIIDTATSQGVERVIFTSSDKAVNPTSVMGTSKLMGERLITSANATRRSNRPIFASTRFGNVLGSRGSVIPLFARQIANGGPVTLTHPEMTRFIMTLQDAVRLVMQSVFLACGGEVFITKMPVARIMDLATVMIEELAPRFGHDPKEIETKLIGVIPGEKLYEELMSDEETRRTIELENYFVVLPALRPIYNVVAYEYPSHVQNSVDHAYNSANEEVMSHDQLRELLVKGELLNEALRSLHVTSPQPTVPIGAPHEPIEALSSRDKLAATDGATAEVLV
ncbi:MAG TPA: polysaccharide biosynthesis protein [Terracidiphilus sp.]|nr:polysaccharide biosynthesis protein [Terracidiphilus sp.]